MAAPIHTASKADPFASTPGKVRAAQAVRAAEVPLNSPRAASYLPTGDRLFLKDIAGLEVMIHNIRPETDDYGVCADLLVMVEGERKHYWCEPAASSANACANFEIGLKPASANTHWPPGLRRSRSLAGRLAGKWSKLGSQSIGGQG